VPRFFDSSTASSLVAFDPCQTTLLFPFVVSQSNFDTGLAISNTTADPFGTIQHSGTCTLTAFGDNAPQPIVTPTISAGKTYTVSASTSMPNFKGYVFAVCNFGNGHGFGFVSDRGIQNFASGYLALVVPIPLGNDRTSTGDSEIPFVSEMLYH
jgi:hypothetical protein